MDIIKKWNSLSLIIRILIGLAIGVILGLTVPSLTWIGVLGEFFVGALKAIAPVLVFVLVSSSLANAKGGNAGKFRTVIILYLLSTLCAAVTSVFVSFISPVKVPLTGAEAAGSYVAPDGMADVVMNLLKSIVVNPVDALVNANYIGILFWAVILGMALKTAKAETRRMMEDLAEAVSTAVRWIISCAPFGILGLSFTAIASSGLEIFKTYGHLVAVLVVSMLLVPLGCSLFGISNDIAMQLVGIGFIISVIQDSLETALNSSGDAIFTATAEFVEWKKQGKQLPL